MKTTRKRCYFIQPNWYGEWSVFLEGCKLSLACFEKYDDAVNWIKARAAA